MKNILRFDIDDENWKLSRKDLIGTMFDIIFTGGPPKGDEAYVKDLKEVESFISQPNITYKEYVRKISFNYSSDSMAYNTPWYNYDKRFGRSSIYRDIIWLIEKTFGMKIAYMFFTEKFRNVIKPTPKNLKGIKIVFFDEEYPQWT